MNTRYQMNSIIMQARTLAFNGGVARRYVERSKLENALYELEISKTINTMNL